MQEHLCYDSFWGLWSPDLVQLLDLIALGDAANMEPATYATLLAALRDIESAAGVGPAEVDDYAANTSSFSPANQALLRAAAHHFQVGLTDDHYDGVPEGHPPKPGWIRNGTAQATTIDAIRVLTGVGSGPVPLYCPPDGLMGRIRAALDSGYIAPPP